MTKLSVNINKIATLRNSRGANNPDVVQAASSGSGFVLCRVELPRGLIYSGALTVPEGVTLCGNGTALHAKSGFTGDLVTLDGHQAGLYDLNIVGNAASGGSHGITVPANIFRTRIVNTLHLADQDMLFWSFGAEACLSEG